MKAGDIVGGIVATLVVGVAFLLLVPAGLFVASVYQVIGWFER